jgi:chaperonin GroES
MDKKQEKNNTEKKVRPLSDRVLIKEIDAKKGGETKSGIIIPETVEKDNGAHRGIVVAVGEGRFDDGVLIPMKVKIGDTVLFQWGDKLTLDGEEYFIVSESNILAVIK